MRFGSIRSYASTTSTWVLESLKRRIGNDMKYVKFMLVVWENGEGSHENEGSIQVRRYEKRCYWDRSVGWKIYIVFQRDKPKHSNDFPIRCNNKNQKAISMTRRSGEGCLCVCKSSNQIGKNCVEVIPPDDEDIAGMDRIKNNLKVPGMFDLKNQIIQSEKNIKDQVLKVINLSYPL